ncbi:MAG TPA: efflux RND transporter periplasmic adaptor subunit [Terriglobia bacterium]|nr:efflux RND transporter periplasmic adaptor subunit [Terriglobia bacterium]
MKNPGRWILSILSVGIVAAAMFVVRRPAVTEETPEPAAAADSTGKVAFLMEQQWQIHLKLAKAESAEVSPQVTSTGRIVAAPRNRAIVAPPVGGIIGAENLPLVGQQVARGQVLAALTETLTAFDLAQLQRDRAQFDLQSAQLQLQAEQLQLDSEQFQLDTDQLELNAAQLRLENARIEAERRRLGEAIKEGEIRRALARTEFDRATRLFEKRAYSQKQVQEAEAAYKAEDAAIAALTAQLNVLNPLPLPAAPARANRPPALSGSRPNPSIPVAPNAPVTVQQVRAPISGTIVKVYKSAGEHVQAGEAMFEIVNLDTVWVEAPIFEKDLARLKAGHEAVFTTAAYPDTEFSGKLVDLGAVIDEETRAASALFEVPNPSRKLKVGMQANVRLDAQERVIAVMIPKESVLDNEGKKIVYILVSGEEFQRVEVQLGDEYGDKVAVLSGLEAGQRVVTQGAYQLKMQELRPAGAGAHTHEV